MKCQNINCEKEAVYEFGLSLRVHMGHTPARTSAMVRVCEEHKDIKWEDLVDDKGWNKICNNFLARGYQVPKRKYSEIWKETKVI